jgi:hypothetical protein
MSVVLGTLDTVQGYGEAEEATRVSGLGLLDMWVYRGVGFGFEIIIFPSSRWLLFLLRLQIYKFRIWIIKYQGSIIVT